MNMKGLTYCRLYYEQVTRPMLYERFPELAPRVAAGLCGDGSECFGFDDEYSKDHDFWAMSCLWLDEEDYKTSGPALRQALEELPKAFLDLKPPENTSWRPERRGVLSIPMFCYQYMGVPGVPETIDQWRRIPEHNLAAFTNGEIFEDPSGKFTAIRTALLAHYPEDLRRGLISGRCVKMAQSGQYNLLRCLRRGEQVAASAALSEFISEAIWMTYLLNRRYRPFYKWMHRGLPALPVLGKQLYVQTSRLVDPETGGREKLGIVEDICTLVRAELKAQGLSDSESDFLQDHSEYVRRSLSSPGLREISPWAWAESRP